MLELLLCSLLTVVPDYLYRRFVQGKRLGEIICGFRRSPSGHSEMMSPGIPTRPRSSTVSRARGHRTPLSRLKRPASGTSASSSARGTSGAATRRCQSRKACPIRCPAWQQDAEAWRMCNHKFRLGKRGSLNVRFAPKATELLRRREMRDVPWQHSRLPLS